MSSNSTNSASDSSSTSDSTPSSTSTSTSNQTSKSTSGLGSVSNRSTEYKTSEDFDHCIARFTSKTGLGLLIGGATSFLLFKGSLIRTAVTFFSAGIGAGSAAGDCNKKLNCGSCSTNCKSNNCANCSNQCKKNSSQCPFSSSSTKCPISPSNLWSSIKQMTLGESPASTPPSPGAVRMTIPPPSKVPPSDNKSNNSGSTQT